MSDTELYLKCLEMATRPVKGVSYQWENLVSVAKMRHPDLEDVDGVTKVLSELDLTNHLIWTDTNPDGTKLALCPHVAIEKSLNLKDVTERANDLYTLVKNKVGTLTKEPSPCADRKYLNVTLRTIPEKKVNASPLEEARRLTAEHLLLKDREQQPQNVYAREIKRIRNVAADGGYCTHYAIGYLSEEVLTLLKSDGFLVHTVSGTAFGYSDHVNHEVIEVSWAINEPTPERSVAPEAQ